MNKEQMKPSLIKLQSDIKEGKVEEADTEKKQ